MLEKIRISLAENQKLFFSNRNQMINRGDVMLVVAKNSKKTDNWENAHDQKNSFRKISISDLNEEKHRFKQLLWQALCKKCPYLELLWSVFSRIWIEYGAILRISPYSVRMWENTDHHAPRTINFGLEYGHFSHSEERKASFHLESLWRW